jgi:hypothetical protein
MNDAASTPNPLLKPLDVLVGNWETIATHPFMPDEELHGNVTFDWIEGGAFLKMQTEIDHPEFPTGVAIIGSDDNGQITMLYFDERNVSRRYQFAIDGNQWKWWRDDADFSQRFVVDIQKDGQTMVSKGEMRRDGSDWEGDLSLTYTRVK